MTNTALITGASSGMGVEFARYHASKGGNLIITARREAALQKLKSELEAKYGVTIHVVALDLGSVGGAAALYEAVQKTGETVKILINNAGFGGHGVHIERQLSQEQAMIDLNIKAVVSLTHMIGNDMVKSGGAKCSTSVRQQDLCRVPCRQFISQPRLSLRPFRKLLIKSCEDEASRQLHFAPAA